MLLVLVGTALALPARSDRSATLGVGLGPAFIAGAEEEPWGVGLAERFSVGLTPGYGGVGSLGLELTHSHHDVVASDAFFPGLTAPADTIDGGTDLTTLDLGYRIGIDLYGKHPPTLRVIPFLRPAVGGALEATVLTVPSFAGRSDLTSHVPSPMLTLAGGAELRIGHVWSIVPALTGHVLLAHDQAEQGQKERWGIYWHVVPSVDVAVSF